MRLDQLEVCTSASSPFTLDKIMDPKNKSAEQILKAKDRLQFSTWHFLQARRLLDYAKRTNSPGALHYSAFEIRYGIEELLFELLVLTKRGLNDKQYKKCIGNPNAMRKMLEHQDVTYSKLLAFTRIAMDMDARPDKPNLRYWELKELFKHWGKVSSYLHFCGPQKATYDSEQWISKALSELDEIRAPLKTSQQLAKTFNSNLYGVCPNFSIIR